MADKAAGTAQSAIQSTQRAADSAFDTLSSKVEDLRGQAAPLINRVSAQAEAAARRGIEAVRDTSQQLREKAPARFGQRGRLRQGRADQGDADRRRDRCLADGPGGAAQPFLARLTARRGCSAMIHPPAAPDHDRAASARRSCRGLCRPGRRGSQEDRVGLGPAPRPLCRGAVPGRRGPGPDRRGADALGGGAAGRTPLALGPGRRAGDHLRPGGRAASCYARRTRSKARSTTSRSNSAPTWRCCAK